MCTETNWDTLYTNPEQNYPIDEEVYNKSGGFSNGYVPLFCVVGYKNKVYQNDGDYNSIPASVRLAIDEMPVPPSAMTISKSSFSPAAAPDASVADMFNIANPGTGQLDYYFSVDYDGSVASGSTWHTNDFNSGIGYTATGWTITAGGTWNGGTDCADAADSTTPSVMTSAAFNTIGIGDRLWLEFMYGTGYIEGSAYITAEYFNGTGWVEVWRFDGNGVGTAKVELPVKAANTQLRFTAVSERNQGTWSIERLDNISVYSDDQAYRWLLFDEVNQWGESTAEGSILGGNDLDFNLTFDATDLAEGTYNADIIVHTNYAPQIDTTIPVTFTVTSGGGPVIPAVPANLTTSISGSDLIVDWDDSADATSYDVYSSTDPYGTFVLLTNVTSSQYTYNSADSKMFFYVIAKNSTKESPKSIIVKAKE